MGAPELPLPEEVVPHAGAMVFPTRVLAHDRARTVCAVAIDRQSLFVESDGGVPAWVGIEYMAQCIAAHAGLVARADGNEPRIGFLLGSRRVVFHCDRFEPGTILRASAERTWGGEDGMVSFECQLEDSHSGALLAEARLNCYLPPEGEGLGGID
jgi:predicted hotdog family 3-hydroxylacyl-ACP dehydratase